MECSKSDWKLFRTKIAQWQENYMDRLNKNDESKLLMKVKGDILHKVRLKTSYKNKEPFLLRNRLTTWFKR